MAHAALTAPAVVLAEAVAAPGQGVAREDRQVLEPLVALPGRADRRYGGARLPVPGRDAAARGEVVVVGEVLDPDGDEQQRRVPGVFRQEDLSKRDCGGNPGPFRVRRLAPNPFDTASGSCSPGRFSA